MSQTAFIQSTVDARVGWLEFNRPPVNAFTREMVDETHDAIVAALGDPAVRVLVLASAIPRYFSAGADLHVFKDIGQDGMRGWAERCHEIVRLLRGSPKPLLAAIRRTVTLGGGMTFEDGMTLELETVVELAGTPDFAEGVDAFLAKRQPKWKTS